MVWPAGASRHTARQLAKLNLTIVDIVNSLDVQEKILALDSDPSPESPAQFATFIQAKTDKWAKVVKEPGVAVD